MLGSALHTVATISLAVLPLASGVAAPPGGGTSPPPVVDIAYMINTSNVSTTVRGVQLSAAGVASGDVALWKLTDAFGGSVSFDPDGNWLAWAQYIDRKGTRGIVAGKPGGAPTTVLTFPYGPEVITRRHGIDTIAWGRGCNGQSVIVFLGDSYGVYDGLYVFDPFAVGGAKARLLYPIKHGPMGSPDRGHGIAFSPQGQHLAFVEEDDIGFNHVVTLPLTCLAGDSLPSAAGEPQRLFPVQSDAGIDGGRAWTLGLDWSPDGHRIAASVAPLLVWLSGMRSWGTARIAVGELAYGLAQGVEQVSAAETAMHMVTSGPAAGQADYSDEYPSWGPSSATAGCDRIAFSRAGVVKLLDVPRTGHGAAECAFTAPTTIINKSISGIDWK
jgi:hypothetical protein